MNLIFFSSCHTNESAPTLQTELTEQLYAESTVTEPVSTYPITKPTEPATEPDLAIAVQPGAHCGVSTDDTTGDYLEYYLFVPQDAVLDMPLIVFLHGDGEAGNLASLEANVLITKLREFYGDNYPFIVLSPCTRTASWIKGTIPSTLKYLIDEIVNVLRIQQAGGNAEMILLSGLMHPQTPYEAYSIDTFRWMLEQ